jgi:hypothetical protein
MRGHEPLYGADVNASTMKIGRDAISVLDPENRMQARGKDTTDYRASDQGLRSGGISDPSCPKAPTFGVNTVLGASGSGIILEILDIYHRATPTSEVQFNPLFCI